MANRFEPANVDWRSSREFFDSLKSALDQLLSPDSEDRYSFSWLGKRQSILATALPTAYQLTCDPEASRDFNDTGNLAIIGDNLDALKLLQESYYRQVKMIYIDPPYNTGHDLILAKTFDLHIDPLLDPATEPNPSTNSSKSATNSAPGTTSDSISVETSDTLEPNSRTRPDFHSNWLSMMYPRLLLAKNLLTEDGAIFISIDQNEFANLKKLCDEVFGEENFLALTMRQKNRVVMKSNKAFKNYLEPVLVYARNKNRLQLSYTKPTQSSNDFSLISAGYGQKDLTFRPGQLHFAQSAGTIAAGKYANCEVLNDSPIVNNVNQQPVIIRGEFKWNQSNLQSKLRRGATIQIKNPATMNLRLQTTSISATPQDYISDQYGLVTNEDAISELAELKLGQYFAYPKPTQLVQFFINLMHDREAIIMDFFAGTGTTGQAVLQQNLQDGGHRQYILVQIAEPVSTPQVKRPRLKTQDQLMLERLRRSGERLRSQTSDTNLDAGFRVFRLQAAPQATNPPTELARLFRIILNLGLPLHLPLQEHQASQTKYYLYGYQRPHSGVAICLERPTEDELPQILARQPSLCVFSESSFVDHREVDQDVDSNDDQHAHRDLETILDKCSQLSPTTQVKVIP